MEMGSRRGMEKEEMEEGRGWRERMGMRNRQIGMRNELHCNIYIYIYIYIWIERFR